MKVLVFGSFNIDKVYRLAHLPDRGQTLYCDDYAVHVGGKGLNQALAFARAGADTFAAGKVGREDGAYLTDYLARGGVDVSAVAADGEHTGHTIIEVDPDGENQMILFGGANREITPADCERILRDHADADLLMTQYETSCVEYMLELAHRAGIRTAVNPSPYVPQVRSLPFERIDILILNAFEGESITGERDPAAVVRALHARSHGVVVLTRGADGAMYFDGETEARVPAFRVDALDTTGAGDTFTGFCLHALLTGASPARALRLGAAASAIEVTRVGAAETIPTREEVLRFLEARGEA